MSESPKLFLIMHLKFLYLKFIVCFCLLIFFIIIYYDYMFLVCII